MQVFDWNEAEREHYRRLFELLAGHLDEKAIRLVGAAGVRRLLRFTRTWFLPYANWSKGIRKGIQSPPYCGPRKV